MFRQNPAEQALDFIQKHVVEKAEGAVQRFLKRILSACGLAPGSCTAVLADGFWEYCGQGQAPGSALCEALIDDGKEKAASWKQTETVTTFFANGGSVLLQQLLQETLCPKEVLSAIDNTHVVDAKTMKTTVRNFFLGLIDGAQHDLLADPRNRKIDSVQAPDSDQTSEDMNTTGSTLERKISISPIFSNKLNKQADPYIDALILPGGESTAIKLVTQHDDFQAKLLHFIHDLKRPVWGTCAGTILLSDQVRGHSGGAEQCKYLYLKLELQIFIQHCACRMHAGQTHFDSDFFYSLQLILIIQSSIID